MKRTVLQKFCIFILVLAATYLFGCSTIASKQQSRWGEPYSGLHYSLERWPDAYHASVFFPPLFMAVVPASAIDIPLSAVTDTILLPFDLIIDPRENRNDDVDQ